MTRRNFIATTALLVAAAPLTSNLSLAQDKENKVQAYVRADG